jgi:hypothetical protein
MKFRNMGCELDLLGVSDKFGPRASRCIETRIAEAVLKNKTGSDF